MWRIPSGRATGGCGPRPVQIRGWYLLGLVHRRGWRCPMPGATEPERMRFFAGASAFLNGSETLLACSGFTTGAGSYPDLGRIGARKCLMPKVDTFLPG